MDVEIRSFELGDYELLVIRDRASIRPLADLVANAEPEELEELSLELGLPAEGIQVDYNCLLVRTGDQLVLVDAGQGSRREGLEGALPRGLQAAGIDVEQINWIIITHADSDHIGGILDEQGALVYPNAHYVQWQGAWEFWQDQGNYLDWPQEIVTFICGTLQAVEPRLQRVGADEEFLPGFQIVPAVGHRHDHAVLRVSSRDEQLLHLADTVVHPIFMDQPHWASPRNVVY